MARCVPEYYITDSQPLHSYPRKPTHPSESVSSSPYRSIIFSYPAAVLPKTYPRAASGATSPGKDTASPSAFPRATHTRTRHFDPTGEPPGRS